MKQRLPAMMMAMAATLAGCQPMDDPAGPSTRPVSGLAGTNWQLVEFQSMDDAQGTTRPADATRYTLSFGPDGRLAARLDCNRGTGPWKAEGMTAEGGSLNIGPLATTRAFCPPPSMGDMIGRQLGYVRSYMLRDGKLYLSLMADGGIIVWEPARP